MAEDIATASDTQKKATPARRRKPPAGTRAAAPAATAATAAPAAPVQAQAAGPAVKMDIYIVDSGWESLPHRVLRGSMEMIKRFLSGHNLYILSPEQSVAFLRRHPHLVGRDPLLAVVDPGARRANARAGFGASVSLGRYFWVLGDADDPNPDHQQLQAMIKMFLRLVNCHDGTKNIAAEFRRFNHKAGARGTLEIVMDSLGKEAMLLGEA